MNASELRIGNIIYMENPVVPIRQFHTIMPQDIADIDSGLVAVRGGRIEPVELTKDILRKCAFSTCGYENIFEKNGLLIGIHEGYGATLRDGNLVEIGNPFKYLHQLQNLYFSLTGEELIFNPKL